MEPHKEETLFQKYAKITAVVSVYWVVSITMVFVNKSLLGGATMGERDIPIFVTFFQCLVTVIACLILTELGKYAPKIITVTPIDGFDWNVARQILPLTVMFVTMITLNNLCLKYVGVAFYYVGRSLSTVFNVIFTYCFLGQTTSRSAVFCCAIIIFGFYLGVDQENVAGSLSISGVLFGIGAAMAVSLNSIFTKKVLPAVNGSIWLLSFYNNVLACLLFMPMMLVFGEFPKIYNIICDETSFFWCLMVVSGLFGFAIGYVTGLQIQVTSPLTHNVSGTAKACAQTVIATWWYVESKSKLWWTSNWVVLAGSLAYTRIKAMEMKQSHAQLPTPVTSTSGKSNRS